MFHHRTVAMLIIVSKRVLHYAEVSSHRCFITTPSVRVKCPDPFTTVVPTFIPELLMGTVYGFRGSFPGRLTDSL